MGRYHLALLLACCVLFALPDTAFGQSDGASPKPSIGSTVIAHQFALLRESARPIIKELNLLDYQWEQLHQIQADWRRQLARVSKTRGSREKQTGMIDQLCEQFVEEIDAVLLPHQTKRLRQVAVQRSVGGNGHYTTARLLASQVVRAELGLSDEFVAQMLKESQQLKGNDNKLLTQLTRQQRKKLTELVGEPFDFEQATDVNKDRSSDGKR